MSENLPLFTETDLKVAVAKAAAAERARIDALPEPVLVRYRAVLQRTTEQAEAEATATERKRVIDLLLAAAQAHPDWREALIWAAQRVAEGSAATGS